MAIYRVCTDSVGLTGKCAGNGTGFLGYPVGILFRIGKERG